MKPLPFCRPIQQIMVSLAIYPEKNQDVFQRLSAKNSSVYISVNALVD